MAEVSIKCLVSLLYSDQVIATVEVQFRKKTVAPCSNSKAEESRGSGYLFFIVILSNLWKSMLGHSDLSFFSTRKNKNKKPPTAASEDVEG